MGATPPVTEPRTKREQMGESVRLIVTARERTPRSPRWASAWRRTLFRYLAALRSDGERQVGDSGARDEGGD